VNIPFTLTQGDLVQEALAVTFAKDQTQWKFSNVLLVKANRPEMATSD
jgi:hypothetical protein